MGENWQNLCEENPLVMSGEPNRASRINTLFGQAIENKRAGESIDNAVLPFSKALWIGPASY